MYYENEEKLTLEGKNDYLKTTKNHHRWTQN